MYMVISPNMLKLGEAQQCHKMKITYFFIFSKAEYDSVQLIVEEKIMGLLTYHKMSKFNPITMSSSSFFTEGYLQKFVRFLLMFSILGISIQGLLTVT